MFEQVLPKTAKSSLALLGASGLLNDSYLAGGTALALQIGHRISVDFDFFTRKKFDAKDLARKFEEAKIGFSLDRFEENTILGSVDKTKFSLFFYDYPLIDKTIPYLGITLASLKDIAAMKLLAVSDRGIKRDFIDLYFMLAVEKFFSMENVLGFYDEKFKTLPQNQGHLLRSLVYFKDADTTDVPKMLKAVSWKDVKKFFETEAKYLAKQLIL
ncbi:MAG: nucleotidyl transferase AbiEii/AbiGii toxin family protein [Candidatus Gribaldobacteria bacterium]|nr:nucleotidyl transferase AbiEii/AbiGii toxin family protein [Candidatus Gribaldobacteria bacterium]